MKLTVDVPVGPYCEDCLLWSYVRKSGRIVCSYYGGVTLGKEAGEDRRNPVKCLECREACEGEKSE